MVACLARRAEGQIQWHGCICYDAIWAAALMELYVPGEPDVTTASMQAWYKRALIYSHPYLSSYFGLPMDTTPPYQYDGEVLTQRAKEIV